MNVGIIGFGSIIKQLERNGTRLEIEGVFEVMDKEHISLPIRMSRESSKGKPDRRLTSVVDPSATRECVAIAISKFRTLHEAIANLAAREGAENGYNIAYMVRPIARPDYIPLNAEQRPDEVAIETANGIFHGKFSGNERAYKLNDGQAKILANWLNNSFYDALIWTALPPNITTGLGGRGNRGREVLAKLRSDKVLLKNTKAYINNLPVEFRTTLHNKILSGNLN